MSSITGNSIAAMQVLHTFQSTLQILGRFKSPHVHYTFSEYMSPTRLRLRETPFLQQTAQDRAGLASIHMGVPT